MMSQPLPHHDARVAKDPLNKPWRFLDLVRGANARAVKITGIAVAAAWIPLALCSAFRGWAVFLSFLTDYASQSRFLVIVPVLILAVGNLNDRHRVVAHHLEMLVRKNQLADFRTSWTSFERLQNSKFAMAVIAALTCVTAMAMGEYLSPNGSEFVSWWKGDWGFRGFSLAGIWGLFISYPIVAFLTCSWLWRQLLWTGFMRSTACLDLRLIAAHPDRVASLGFLEASLRGQTPFCFCMGVALTGAVANRVFHHGEKLMNFTHVAVVLAAAVLLIGVAPYFVFTPILMLTRRRGMLAYGALAHAAGDQFEKKWLHLAGSLHEDALAATDFSATNQLYSITSNVNAIQVLPASRVDVASLIVAAFAPAVPLLIGAIPMVTLVREAIKLLF
jgi:hypothetical protein